MPPQPPPSPPESSTGNSNYTVVKVGLGGGGSGYHYGLPDSLYSSGAPPPQGSMLNVSDPRLSATYGNPLLRQVRVTSNLVICSAGHNEFE